MVGLEFLAFVAFLSGAEPLELLLVHDELCKGVGVLVVVCFTVCRGCGIGVGVAGQCCVPQEVGCW